MSTIKRLRNWIPETYLLLSVIYYWFLTGTFWNPVAMVLLSVLVIFIWLKIRTLGILISAVFLLLNLYMVLALIDELNDFATFDQRAMSLLLFGSVYVGLNILLSTLMLIKWTTKNPELTAAG